MRPTTFQHAELRDENDEIIQPGTYGKGSALSNRTNDGWIDYVMNNLEALKRESVSTDSPAFTGIPTAPTPLPDDDSTQIATTEFVQNIKDDEVTRADEKYLPFAGGTVSGDLTVNGTIRGSVTGNADTATNATNDKNGNDITETYIPLSGGTVTGDLEVTGDLSVDGTVTGDLEVTGDLSVDGTVTGDLVDVKSGSNIAVNTLQRETAYNVGDIVYTSELNARYYLLCVTAGTTTSTLPSFSGAESNTQITDGTVVWQVQTVTSQENVDEKFAQTKEYVDNNFVPLDYTETATLLGSSTIVETAVAFGNIENLDYKRYLFTIDIQLSGEDFMRGTAVELSKTALLTNGAHAYNYGSSAAQNWCTLFFIVNPSIGVSYWAGGVTNPSSAVTSMTFRVYGIK